VPADQLLLADAVRICVHEQLRELSSDNERLRIAAGGARETAARAEDEVSRLQRENARLAAAVVSGLSDLAGCKDHTDMLAASPAEVAAQANLHMCAVLPL
jgi:outer membrane murein-binding lipoprotein Lpp